MLLLPPTAFAHAHPDAIRPVARNSLVSLIRRRQGAPPNPRESYGRIAMRMMAEETVVDFDGFGINAGPG
jgi:hypothetical protein